MPSFSFGYPNYLEPPVFRPPSEANSLILQATLGCSHNQCSFCGSYRSKRFNVKPFKQFREEVRQLAQMKHIRPQRIFLADGDAFVLSTNQLLEILNLIYEEFPSLERVSIYASGTNVQRKTDEELQALHEAGLDLIYIGIESGDDEVLQHVNKGITNQEHIDACLRLKRAGFTLSLIVILGLGGKNRSKEHALHTATTINTIDPQFFAALTLMLVSGTELYAEVEEGTFLPLDPLETLQELRILIDELDQLTHCVFRTNHASNYLPLRGILSRDRPQMLELIDSVLNDPKAATQLRPEYVRGL